MYWLIQDRKIEAEALFVFSDIYWPAFIKKDGYIFLREQFSEEEYSGLIKTGTHPEYWINLFTVDEFFSEIPNKEEKSIAFINVLAEIWETKLKKDFPDMNFTIECLWNKEYEDCGLTFYQTDKKKKPGSFRKIATPHIKENKSEQSTNGPRPGISKIRKPRPDELPQ